MLEVSPERPGALWTYVSIGAWEVEPESDPRMEFVLHAPAASNRAALVVEMAAFYHANTDPTYRLGHGHTVPIGESWLGTSNCTHLLVSKPYPLGPTFAVFDEAGVHVHFNWLLPITEAERAFRDAKGLEALEQRFEDVGLEYWEVNRASVIPDVEAESE